MLPRECADKELASGMKWINSPLIPMALGIGTEESHDSCQSRVYVMYELVTGASDQGVSVMIVVL